MNGSAIGTACGRIRRCRQGFSLLEVLLSLAILGGSLAVLSQIAEIGTTAAREARELAVCRLLCQRKMSELLLEAASGITPQSVFNSPLDSFDSGSLGNYNHTVEIGPAPLDGLIAMQVTVQAVEEDQVTPVATFSLSRWFVDPTLNLELAEANERDLWEQMTGATP